MAKPRNSDEAAAFLLDAVRKGCLGEGDEAAVLMLLRDREHMERAYAELYKAAEGAADLLGVIDSDFKDGRADLLEEVLGAADGYKHLPPLPDEPPASPQMPDGY